MRFNHFSNRRTLASGVLLGASLVASVIAISAGATFAGERLSEWQSGAPGLGSFDLFWPNASKDEYSIISALNLASGLEEKLSPKLRYQDVTLITADQDGSVYTYPCDGQGSKNCIGVYPYRNERQVRAIRGGVYRPIAMIARNRQLYVADGNNSITVYEDLGSTRSQQITNGINNPVSIAVDDAENLYVANSASSSVSVYRAGRNRPFEMITAGVASPVSIATDEFGTLYVMNAHGRVSEYASGSTNPVRTVTRECTGFYKQPLMAVASDGTLFEACNGGEGTWIFNRGSTKPDYFIKNEYRVNGVFAGPSATLVVFAGPYPYPEIYVYAYGMYQGPLWAFGNVFGWPTVAFGRAW